MLPGTAIPYGQMRHTGVHHVVLVVLALVPGACDGEFHGQEHRLSQRLLQFEPVWSQPDGSGPVFGEKVALWAVNNATNIKDYAAMVAMA